MASVLRHLFDTMSMYAAAPKSHHTDATLEPYAKTGITAFKKIKILSNEVLEVPAPPVPTDSKWSDQDKERDAEVKKAKDRPLWSFKHDAAKPNRVTRLACRVRETGYKNHVVADSIEWGCEKDGKLEPHVKVVVMDGWELELPLDTRHLYARFLVDGGKLSTNEMKRFPLEMQLDKGLVVAFAYQLDDEGKVQPYKPDEKDEGDLALRHGYMGYWHEEGWTAGAEDEPDNRWIDRALRGGFLEVPKTEKVVTCGKVGEKEVVKGTENQILVAICLSCAKERPDFEPIGIVGMSRFYPHLMFRAGFAVKSVQMSVRFKRPAKTTTIPEKDKSEGNGTVKGTCCGSVGDIGSMLVADNNQDWLAVDLFYLPFWSGLFAYYAIDPEKSWKGTPLKVIDATALARNVKATSVRDTPQFPDVFKSTTVPKVARQGQFDNIHVSPRLKVSATHVVVIVVGPKGWKDVEIDPARMKLESVAMAPFCSHDCLHMHWRWSSQVEDDATWTFGFDGDTPYAKKGAPMVPDTHDVWITPHAPNEFTYTERAYGEEKLDTPQERRKGGIPPYKWLTFCYAGGAYAQSVSDWRTLNTVKFRMGMPEVKFCVLEPRRKTLDLDDPPVFYWNMRHFYEEADDGQYEAKEWLTFTSDELEKARKG